VCGFADHVDHITTRRTERSAQKCVPDWKKRTTSVGVEKNNWKKDDVATLNSKKRRLCSGQLVLQKIDQ